MTFVPAHRGPAYERALRADHVAAAGRVSRAEVEACLSRPEDPHQSAAPDWAAALPEAA
jgi:hypothetical protein